MPETHSITFPDQSTSELRVFRAEKENAPILIIFTAMGVKAAYYRYYAARMIDYGIHVALIDQRGNGKSSIRAGNGVDFGYKEIVEMDYPVILKKIRELFPESKRYIMGHSLGGQMGSMFASKHPELVDGLILNASCLAYYKGWKGWQQPGLLFAGYLCEWISSIIGYFPGKQLNFGDREAKRLMHDWAYTLKTGKYKAEGSDFDYEKAIAEMQLPVLALSYEGDSSAPKKALANLCEKFVSNSSVKHQHLAHPQAPQKKFTHYSWVREPEISIGMVADWILN